MTGFGVATSTIDAESFPETSPQRKEYQTSKDLGVLTGMVGGFYELRRGRVMLAIGREFVGKNLKDWIYKRAPYISISIGTPLFSVSNTKGKNEENERNQ